MVEKADIRCSGCEHLHKSRPARRTKGNEHRKYPRQMCYCFHPLAEESRAILHPDQDYFWPFICYTSGDGQPKHKTCPKWCPLKMMQEPMEITKEEAYRIIDTRKPRGLFFLKEQGGYTGIDNRTGDAWTEDFESRPKCLKWLVDKKDGENDKKG